MLRNKSNKVSIYYSDGYTIMRNPSVYGGGYVICNEKGEVLKHEVVEKQGLTNNEAELLGVYETLKLCAPFSKIIIDSMTIFYWVRSGKPKARKDLTLICSEAKRLKEEKKIEIEWKKRDFNLAGIFIEKMQFENKFL